jgi:2-polyprenyl-6-methoxyphenol hydroxylase-like FAD-dependent oxidoreductase
MSAITQRQRRPKLNNNVKSDTSASVEDIPVLISGCGPVGMMMSILLSRQGIRNLIVEKRERVSMLPRSRGITSRTMEIFDQLGLTEEVNGFSLPPLWTKSFVYTQTLAGEIVGIMSSSSMAPNASAAVTPSDYKVATQDLTDPMLYRHAVGYSEAEIRFNTELLDYVEQDNAVVTRVRTADGATSHVRSQYLIAADGGKSLLRQQAGIATPGSGTYSSSVNCQFRADLSRFVKGREGTLIWTLAPGLNGVFHNLDGDKMWIVRIQFDPTTESHDSWTIDRVISRARKMIGGPEADTIQFDVVRSYTFDLSIAVSERLRKGRLLLVGDAAHQIMPHGGFGMNTGIQTAHNLAWKLGAVLRGEAPEALLDTFDSERREVANRVCAFSKTNAGYIEKMKTALKTASSAEERQEIVAASKQYGNWLGLDLGVHYEGAGAFVSDDVEPPVVDDPVIDFVPHAKPGHRAPHLWVRQDRQRVSTVKLFDRSFVLLAGPEGSAWVDAARRATAPAINAYRVAHDGDLQPEGDFCGLYGIETSGTVLVRPDGHVAYRAPAVTSNPRASLQEALDQVLKRRINVTRAQKGMLSA